MLMKFSTSCSPRLDLNTHKTVRYVSKIDDHYLSVNFFSKTSTGNTIALMIKFIDGI